MAAERAAMEKEAAKQKDSAAAAEAAAKANELASKQAEMEAVAAAASMASAAMAAKLAEETKKAEEAAQNKAEIAVATLHPEPKKITPRTTIKSSKRKTITGMSYDGQQKILLALMVATREFDTDSLEDNLAQCTRHGIDSNEWITHQALFNDLQTQAFVIAGMREWKEKVESGDGDMLALTVLKNLLTQARKLNVDDDICREIAPAIQSGVKKRARCTVRGSIFNTTYIDDMEFAERAFTELANFPSLKSPASWRGHRSSRFFGMAASCADVMLVHSKNELKEALTKLSPSKEAAAMQAYRNILGWMGDKPSPQSQRFGFSEEIVNVAKSDPGLGDEVYIQLMKQLTGNPSPRSVLSGFKLMLVLTQQVAPSENLDEFLRAFLVRAVRNQQADEVPDIAKRCIAELNIIEMPERVTGEEADVIAVQVLLIDNSVRKVHVQKTANLETLGEKLAEQLKVHNGRDFSFYQLTDGLELHRLLPENSVIHTLFQKWQKIKAVAHRGCRLLWKRRFLRADEILRAGDTIHATLTYRQALWDFLHYPISEDFQLICEIAASILYVDHDHYKDRFHQLPDEGILEQLIPAHLLGYNQRAQWASLVMVEYRNLENAVGEDAHETRLQAMGRSLSLMQRLRLFGAYTWFGRQTYKIPPEKVSIHDAPRCDCKINPRESEAEYWICVDIFGVRFISVDSAPHTQFQRGFLFNGEAMERVCRWGAKSNIVQFIVQTINPVAPADRSVPMTISLLSPAAIDIAYVIYAICKGQL